jgi:leucyl aminopeptidase
MNFVLKSLDFPAIAQQKADVLVVLVSEILPSGQDDLSVLIRLARQSGDLDAKPGKLLQLYRAAGTAAARVVLASIGEGTAKQVRQAVSAATAALKGCGAKTLIVSFATQPEPKNLADAVRAAVLSVAEASYVYTTTKPKAEARSIERVVIALPLAKAVKEAFACAEAMVAGIEFAKEWANRPANHATPDKLADAAKSLAKLPGIKCEVLGPKEVEKLGMGAFMAVAQGSDEPLRFIILKYQGAGQKQAPVVLVGKGITFDTGGISIKPAPDMDEMKFDMSGAASVLGTFRALADLKPKVNVIGLIPACENMPSGRAIKPGDVVTSMSGQTIEILNTDAEGRLVLCDALTYAERFEPAAVIDIATLTGACVVALGGVRCGMFASDETLAQALHSAGESAQDLCWRMPLDDDYAEGLKTNFADVANIAGRQAGAVTAAKFLQRFTSKYPWAHLDIAGVAWKSGANKGATGRPVAMLVEYLLGQAAVRGGKSSD